MTVTQEDLDFFFPRPLTVLAQSIRQTTDHQTDVLAVCALRATTTGIPFHTAAPVPSRAAIEAGLPARKARKTIRRIYRWVAMGGVL